jgi:hypothetical protein
LRDQNAKLLAGLGQTTEKRLAQPQYKLQAGGETVLTMQQKLTETKHKEGAKARRKGKAKEDLLSGGADG